MNPSIPLLLICLLFSFAAPASSTALSFSVNMTLTGDASIADNTITLTHPTPGSVGQALYSRPVRFLAPTANSPASFSSRFTFSITPSPAAIGDGLAFLITSVPGTPSGYLGLFHDRNGVVDKINNATFALEFDHHVSLDIGTNLSAASADPRDAGIDIRAGIPVTAWVEYTSREKAVRVWLSYSRFRSTTPLLHATVDLSGYFHEFMHVGFSASSGQGGDAALHVIRHWNFHTFGLPPVADGAAGTGSSPTPSSPAPAPSQPRNGKNHKGSAFLVASTLVALAILCSAAMAWWCRAPGLMTTAVTGSQLWLREPPANGARLRLPLDEIKMATKGFHASKLIGPGTTGTAVYAGVLRGRRVAVKRFFRVERFTRALSAELTAAGRVRHRNMVALTGWCCECNELVLVYEFIPNGTLDLAIRGGSTAVAAVLTWERRWRILCGVASALDHLHHDCEKPIIHRAVTSRNVLIDGGFNGRLGDLTAADDTGRSGGGTPLVLKSAEPMASLLGYLAPEYLHTGVATEMSDVYGFGVVALEVATGRRPIDRGVALVDWVWGMLGRGRLVGAADPKLRGGFVRDEMVKVLTVGLCCAHPDSRERPSMKRVVRMLEGSTQLPELPEMKPAINLVSHVPPEYTTTDTDNTAALLHATQPTEIVTVTKD